MIINPKKKSVIVIGAGMVGLATARELALLNYNVTVFEQNERAIGASKDLPMLHAVYFCLISIRHC